MNDRGKKKDDGSRCGCTACFKYHCVRHRRNHKDKDAPDLNPYGEARCPRYLPRHAVTESRPSVSIPCGQVLKNDRQARKGGWHGDEG